MTGKNGSVLLSAFAHDLACASKPRPPGPRRGASSTKVQSCCLPACDALWLDRQETCCL